MPSSFLPVNFPITKITRLFNVRSEKGQTESVIGPRASDSVTRVIDLTRVESRLTIFGDSDTTRVTLKKMVTRLESPFSQNDSSHNQWLEFRVRVVFAKSQNLCLTNPVCLHQGCGVGSPVIRLRLRLREISIIRLRLQLRLRLRADSDLQLY